MAQNTNGVGDINLTVGIDINASTQAFKNQLPKLAEQINNLNLMKIKVELDESTTKGISQTVSKIQSSINNINVANLSSSFNNVESSATGVLSTVKKVTEEFKTLNTNQIQSAFSDIKLDEAQAKEFATALGEISGVITKIKAQTTKTGGGASKYVDVIMTIEDALGKTVTETVRWDTANEKVKSRVQQISQEFKGAKESLNVLTTGSTELAQAMDTVAKFSTQIKTSLSTYSSFGDMEAYSKLSSLSNEANELLQTLSSGNITVSQFNNLLSNMKLEFDQTTGTLKQVSTLTDQFYKNIKEWSGTNLVDTKEFSKYSELKLMFEALVDDFNKGKVSSELFGEGLTDLQSKAISLETTLSELAKQNSEILTIDQKPYSDALRNIDTMLREVTTKIGEFKAQLSSTTDANVIADLNDLISKYGAYRDQLENLRVEMEKENVTQSQYRDETAKIKTEMNSLVDQINRVTQAKKLQTQSEKEAEQAQQLSVTVEQKYQNVIAQLTSFLTKYTAAKKSSNIESRNAYEEIERLVTELEREKAGLDGSSASYKKLSNNLTLASAKVKENTSLLKQNGDATKSLSDRMSGLASKFSAWLSVSSAIMYGVRAIKQLVTASKEIEDAMTQLSIVTGKTGSALDEAFTSATSLAKELGQSITDVSSSIETFARLGYNMTDSSELAKYATILSNVADTSVEESTTGLTSIIKGFDLEVSDASHIADVLVSIGQGLK